MQEASSPRQAAWSRYWSQGALHSLGGSLPDDYRGNIQAFWNSQFHELHADQRVLDIGTGNGSLPALLWQRRAAAMPRVDAIDLAEIAPVWITTSPPACQHAIHFHSGVAVESLPFGDRTFDLVISQYGFEYADHAVSAREVTRVLKPGAKLALLMHHAQSRLTNVAEEEYRHVDWLLQADGLLDLGHRMYRYMALAGSPGGRAQLAGNSEATGTRNRYNDVMQALRERAQESRFPDLLLEAREFIADQLDVAARTSDASSTEQRHDRYRDELADAALRYRELCTHALGIDEANRLAERFREAGMAQIDYAPMHHENGMLMGWTMTGQKAPG